MGNLKLFVPMTKVDEEKRLVYGIATQEVLDKSGEIMDYETSKPNFEKWSQDIEKASGGKSLGNLREMHSNKAAGKLTQLDFNDETKAIEVCAKVVDEESWNKVLEGVLNGFSIGGSYAKRWKDENGATRFTAEPAEISLVDNPCCPTATFEVIKADGVTEQRQFQHKEEEKLEIDKTILAEMQKAFAEGDLAKAFSFEEIRDRVRGALGEKITTPFNAGYFWIIQTYPDHVIIEGDLDGDGDNDMYSIPYTIDDQGKVTVDVDNAKQVQVQYVHTIDEDADDNALKSAGDELNKKDYSEEERKKMAEKGEAMPDGSFPIKTAKDVENAVHDWGRAGSKESVKEHIIQRAKAIGAEDKLPEDWIDGGKDDKTEKNAEIDDLIKAGAKFSKENMAKLQQMHHAIGEMGGACKCDKCMKMYKDDMALAAPAADLHKSSSELAKAMEGISALQKAVESLKADNEALQKKVTELENQPLPGGPVLNGSMAMNKSLPGNLPENNSPVDELDMLKKLRDEETDPMVKQTISQKIAMKEIKKAQSKATAI